MSGGRVLRLPVAAPAPEPGADPGPPEFTQADLDAARMDGFRMGYTAVFGALRAELGPDAQMPVSLLRPVPDARPEPAWDREAGA